MLVGRYFIRSANPLCYYDAILFKVQIHYPIFVWTAKNVMLQRRYFIQSTYPIRLSMCELHTACLWRCFISKYIHTVCFQGLVPGRPHCVVLLCVLSIDVLRAKKFVYKNLMQSWQCVLDAICHIIYVLLRCISKMKCQFYPF